MHTVERTRSTHAHLAEARARLQRDDEEIVRVQSTIAGIGAPTGDEAARGSWVARRMLGVGLHGVATDAVGNVSGTRTGRDPALAPVLVCAHLDTVFPHGTPLLVRRHGSRLTAPGIGDNARGLAALLALAAVIDGRAVATDRSVRFVATVGEEGLGDLRGAKHLFDSRRDASPAAAIALDGPGDDRVVHQALGSRRFRVTFAGPGGHSWAAFGAPNAVHAAGAAIAALARIALPRTPRTTLSVGRVGGGLSVNTIPADAWFEVDVRSLDAPQLAHVERELRALVSEAVAGENARRAAGTAPLSAHVETIGDRPAGTLSEQHPIVVAACEATRLVGREPQLAVASTDANVPIALGIPAVAIGAGGDGGDAHTEGEWYDNRDGTRGLARALTLVSTAALGSR